MKVLILISEGRIIPIAAGPDMKEVLRPGFLAAGEKSELARWRAILARYRIGENLPNGLWVCQGQNVARAQAYDLFDLAVSAAAHGRWHFLLEPLTLSDFEPRKTRMKDLHTLACQIVSIFETGSPEGDPGRCSVLADGAGITYGIHQGTDASGTLDEILLEYDHQGGRWRRELSEFYVWLSENGTRDEDPKNPTPQCERLIALLRSAGKYDPIMRAAQEAVFERLYWRPAMGQAIDLHLRFPLSQVCLYDLAVQSGLGRLAKLRLAFSQLPPSKGGSEEAWTLELLRARRAFLLRSSNELVRKSVYRVEALMHLAEVDQWQLQSPFLVRGWTL